MAFNWSVTTVLAVWGAFLSTFTLGWNLYRELKARPRLALRHDLDLDSQQRIRFEVTTTNRRPRPITLVRWGIESIHHMNGKRLNCVMPLNATELPKLLHESEQITFSESAKLILDECVRRVFVEDSSGKRWYLRKNKLTQARNDYAVMKARLREWAESSNTVLKHTE